MRLRKTASYILPTVEKSALRSPKVSLPWHATPRVLLRFCSGDQYQPFPQGLNYRKARLRISQLHRTVQNDFKVYRKARRLEECCCGSAQPPKNDWIPPFISTSPEVVDQSHLSSDLFPRLNLGQLTNWSSTRSSRRMTRGEATCKTHSRRVREAHQLSGSSNVSAQR